MLQPSDPTRLPLERQVPAEPVASPALLPPSVGPDDEQWYLPGYAQMARLLGWRWVFVLPAVAVVIAAAMIPLHPWLLNVLLASWKLVIMAVAIPVGVLAKYARNAVRSRSDPFCIHCGYGLSGLPDHHVCPECGRVYELAMVEEYRRDPHWFIERHRRRLDLPTPPVPFDAGPVRRRRKSRDGTW